MKFPLKEQKWSFLLNIPPAVCPQWLLLQAIQDSEEKRNMDLQLSTDSYTVEHEISACVYI